MHGRTRMTMYPGIPYNAGTKHFTDQARIASTIAKREVYG